MKTVHDELIKSPEVQAMAKRMTTDGSLPFYRKGMVFIIRPALKYKRFNGFGVKTADNFNSK